VPLAAERLTDQDWNTASDEVLGRFILSLRTRGVRDQRLLTAIESVPRSHFLPLAYGGLLWEDISLPLPFGQETGRLSAKIDVLHALDIRPDHQVLEIGTGSGWQTGLLAHLCGAVASVERWGFLAHEASLRLRELGMRNAIVLHGDGESGLPAAAPFDRIVINAAVASVPASLVEQMADQALLVAPVLDESGQSVVRFCKRGGKLDSERLFAIDTTPLQSGISHPL
jgi:protein-L-isoaspartate(D-aspartate) O-methyltransferase